MGLWTGDTTARVRYADAGALSSPRNHTQQKAARERRRRTLGHRAISLNCARGAHALLHTGLLRTLAARVRGARSAWTAAGPQRVVLAAPGTSAHAEPRVG